MYFFLDIGALLLGTGRIQACSTHGVRSDCSKFTALAKVADRRFLIHWRWAYFHIRHIPQVSSH